MVMTTTLAKNINTCLSLPVLVLSLQMTSVLLFRMDSARMVKTILFFHARMELCLHTPPLVSAVFAILSFIQTFKNIGQSKQQGARIGLTLIEQQ